MPAVSFPKAQSLGEREWGSETLVAFLPGHFAGKVLVMKAGAMGGLQYHRHKHEFGFVQSGYLLLTYEQGGALHTRILGPGDTVEIPPEAVHQEKALTDCVIFEVSSPVFQDRVRVEERFGLPQGTGLPTTQESEIRYEP